MSKGATDAEHSVPAKTTPEDHAMLRSPNAVLSLLPAGPKAVGSQASAEMCRRSRGPAHQASRKRGPSSVKDVVLPSDECFRPPEGTCTPRPTEFHASPSSHRGGQGALHTPHTQVAACFGAAACQETLGGSKCMCHQTNGSQPSSQPPSLAG